MSGQTQAPTAPLAVTIMPTMIVVRRGRIEDDGMYVVKQTSSIGTGPYSGLPVYEIEDA